MTPRIKIADCRKIVGRYYRVRKREMLGRSQERKYAWPRQMAWALAIELTGRSLPVVGYYFDRDHTTVLLGIRAFRARMKERPGLIFEMENFRLALLTHRAQLQAMEFGE